MPKSKSTRPDSDSTNGKSKSRCIATVVDDGRDNFTIISDELSKYGGYQKSSRTSRFVCCPFHADGSPSCSVHMVIEESKIPLGFFFCFGCGTKGGWNTFAEKAGLERIKEWRKSDAPSSVLITPEIEDKLLGSESYTFKHVLKIMGCEEAIRWPPHLDWRGFDGALIYKVGGHIINDDRNDDIGLLFPIKIQGKVRGAVKAVRERKHKKQLAYVTMEGKWVAAYGLFPYMHTQSILRKTGYDFAFIVEGPRDALRMVSLGIPTVAMLGATSMSDTKALLLSGLGISKLYVLSDNDSGGDTMWKTVKKVIQRTDQLSLTRIRLPKEFDAKGELIKMDPGNMPELIVNKIVRILKEKHGFVKVIPALPSDRTKSPRNHPPNKL